MKHIPKGLARTRLACYMGYFTNASVCCVPPLLFVTFHECYGISYTLLGTLIAVNFFTQLLVDLLCTALSKRYRVERALPFVPLLLSLGLALYGLLPLILPRAAYLGLTVGTLIFSVAAGLCEVLLSPTVAAIPSNNPGRDMSILHSLFGFGVVAAVLLSTLVLHFLGRERWHILMLILAALPLIPTVLFFTSPIPKMEPSAPPSEAKEGGRRRRLALALCVGCIFFGSCAENTMSNWLSSYMENALGIEKAVGDILGAAGFALLLALVRILYARFGKDVRPVLLVGMIGCFFCYLVSGLAAGAVLPMIACILVGIFSSMLWPGTLILMEENVKAPGVAAFALLAAAGDLGAAAAPQLMGILIDAVARAPFAQSLCAQLSATPEQIGLRAAMLSTAVYPLIGTVLVLIAFRFFKKKSN